MLLHTTQLAKYFDPKSFGNVLSESSELLQQTTATCIDNRLNFYMLCGWCVAVKGDNPETESKVSSESDSTTPRTPRSGMFEDAKFFGSSFSLENLSDEFIKAGVSAKGKIDQLDIILL